MRNQTELGNKYAARSRSHMKAARSWQGAGAACIAFEAALCALRDSRLARLAFAGALTKGARAHIEAAFRDSLALVR